MCVSSMYLIRLPSSRIFSKQLFISPILSEHKNCYVAPSIGSISVNVIRILAQFC